MVTVKFSLRATPPPRQNVYITGSCPELGQWDHEAALQMTHCQSESTWYLTVDIQSTKTLEYRYFLGKMLSNQACHGAQEEGGCLMVECWEGGPIPRQACLAEESELTLNDKFGKIGNGDVVYPGWLTKQKEVRLIFHSDAFQPLSKRLKSLSGYRILCLPLISIQDDHDLLEDDEEACCVTEEMLYLDLNDGKMEFSQQPEFGVPVVPESIITFRLQTVTDWNVPIRVTIYQESSDSNGILPLIGYSVILPANLHASSSGMLQLPVHGINFKICGQITLDYLVIKPLPNYKCEMSRSCALQWESSHRMLYVGHRGMGTSRNKHVTQNYKENTIQSFNEAASHGADFVEFDVQLTKDHVPVIFHDFNCRLRCSSFSGSQASWHEVAVITLTYNQLKKLQIGFSPDSGSGAILYEGGDGDNLSCNNLFPTVVEAFESVSPTLGFNIEVKYPMKLENGSLEDGLETFMDMNKYMDILVEDILTHAGERNIIFTSFNPDVCIMLRLKQNRYPVSLLTQGKTDRYMLYKDPRTHDIRKVLHMAKAEHFLGVNPISEYVLKDPTLIQRAHDLGLVMMSWGTENQDKAVQKLLKEQRIHGMIFDNVDEVIGAEKS